MPEGEISQPTDDQGMQSVVHRSPKRPEQANFTHSLTHSLTLSLIRVCLTQHQKATIQQKETTMYSGRLLCDYCVPRQMGRNRTTRSAAFCSDVLGGMKVPGSWVLRADPH